MPAPSDAPPVAGPVLAVHVGADGATLVGGAVADSAGVVAAVRKHVRTHPDGAVWFATTRGTLYAQYVRVLDTIRAAYHAERDDVAPREFGAPFADLDDGARAVVRKRVPMRVVFEEPR